MKVVTEPPEPIPAAQTLRVAYTDDPREVDGEGGPSDPGAQDARVLAFLTEEQQARVAALREARVLLGTQGNYGALRAGAGELAALASFILDGKPRWADGDDDEDIGPD
jgi:hypothetical protein